ncbi:anthocyanidin reductase ((2S)-flavan-3-ol-forming)-like isoform X2 [Papaver somniferum]|uniref:anthocyanidin reductase ((2S)-flavan-3-ol-forming)-like isoform X2 n=1 Tax=Papaver somniferum TaxID=3469 RepID=UPI000E6F5FDB|nr:anthocyanidin reductase ((2S)-flavan-3-ol-forming)-like isoform X2 [Papaver somniferum]
MADSKKKVCVTGGTGYMASKLVKHLLDKGYSVNTTARNPEDEQKVAHLLKLVEDHEHGDLKIFQADLTNEGSFDDAISGCSIVFHVATPVHFASQNPEADMIRPAIQGTLDILQSCVNAKTVKRVVLTSSAAAVSIKDLSKETGGLVMDESCWTDIEYLTSAKPPTWGYPVSKALAEKEAWKCAEENKIDLITVIPSLMLGPSLTHTVPSSICLGMSLLTGMQMLSGSISITHVEDVVDAHIFLAEKESASGRYICCNVNTSVLELAKFLSHRYPQYAVTTEFGDFPATAKLSLSSEKLINEGFSFNYGIEEIYDQSVEYFKSVGLLQK